MGQYTFRGRCLVTTIGPCDIMKLVISIVSLDGKLLWNMDNVFELPEPNK